MANEYTEVSHRNYFQRLGDSFKGIVTGIIFLIGSTYALYWNETRINLFEVAKESKEFTKGDIVDNKTLISYTGKVTTFESVGDNQFIKPMKDIVALTRTIEMYAWEETTSTTTTESASGSSTTETKYSYSKTWTSSPQNSSHFKYPDGHYNPSPKIPAGVNTYKPTNINIDTYALEPYKLSVSTFKKLALSPDKLQKNVPISGDYIYLAHSDNSINSSYNSYSNNNSNTYSNNNNNYNNDNDRSRRDEFNSNPTPTPNVSANNYNNNYNNNSYTNTNYSNNPQVGDIRISYSFFPSNIQTTVFGIMDSSNINPYTIKNEDFLSKMTGGLYRLFRGDRDAALSDLKTEESFKLWIIRIAALIFMFTSFNLIFGPINAIFNILKISTITRFITGIISFILTFIIATLAILFGKLASFFGFIGAIVAIIVAVFVTIKFVFNKR